MQKYSLLKSELTFSQILRFFSPLAYNIIIFLNILFAKSGLIISERTFSQNPASFLSISLSGLAGFSRGSHHISHKNTRASHKQQEGNKQMPTQNDSKKNTYTKKHINNNKIDNHTQYIYRHQADMVNCYQISFRTTVHIEHFFRLLSDVGALEVYLI